MDKITVKGLEVFAYHGVNPEEQEQGQLFILDIVAKLNLQVPCQTDNIEDTVSYAKILKTAQTVMVAQKDFLIERAAQRVSDAILKSFPAIHEIKVTLKKPNAPIKAEFAYTSVTITRGRDSLE